MKLSFYTKEKVVCFPSELENTPCSGSAYSSILLARTLANRGINVTVYNHIIEGIDNDVVFRLWDGPDGVADHDVFIAVGEADKILLRSKIMAKKRVLWSKNFFDHRPYYKAYCAGLIDKVVCNSANHLSSLARCGWIRDSTYIYNPFVVPEFLQKPFPSDPNILRTIFVGAFVKAKSFFNVLRLARELNRLGVPLRMTLIGGTGLYDGYDDDLSSLLGALPDQSLLINARGELHSYIRLLGRRSRIEIYEELRHADLFISGINTDQSGAETLGMAFLEAQAAGVPVFTFNRGAQFEAVSPAMRLSSKPSIRAAAWKIKSTFESGALLKMRGACESATFLHRFHPERAAAQWLKLFTDESQFYLKKWQHALWRCLSVSN